MTIRVYFCHSAAIWNEYPDLAAGALAAEGITAGGDVESPLVELVAAAASRLAAHSEGELPEIQAWRRAFARMGLKPTQYRCASEALLRRYRKEGSLPRIHPLIDLCNAASMAFAIPVAVFDLAKISDQLEVRHADGSEHYEAFSGETEHPAPGEVIFADAAGNAHARRWTNRQSRRSAVGEETTHVLIVAEALHGSAREDVQRLLGTLTEGLASVWSTRPSTGLLTSAAPRFELEE